MNITEIILLEQNSNKYTEKIEIQYKYDSIIGNGYHGLIYKFTGPKRSICLKIFQQNDLKDSSFLNEYSILQKFQQESEQNNQIPGKIVQLIDKQTIVNIDQINDYHQETWFLMEFCKGERILNFMGYRCFKEQEAIQICLKIVIALESIWSKGYVHSDIKPQNILVNPNILQISDNFSKNILTSVNILESLTPTQQAQIVIIDFGFSVPIGSKCLGTTNKFADPDYDFDNLNESFDIYSFGITIYHLFRCMDIKFIETLIQRCIAPIDIRITRQQLIDLLVNQTK